MPELEEISKAINQWVVDNFPLAKDKGLDIDDSLLDSGIVDSLGTLEIVQYLESEFGIEISDEDMVADHFESVRSISRLVTSRIGATKETT